MVSINKITSYSIASFGAFLMLFLLFSGPVSVIGNVLFVGNNTEIDSVPDALLVKFKSGASEMARLNALSKLGASVDEEIEGIVHVIRVPAHARDKVKAALSRSPVVEFVEYDYFLKPAHMPNDPTIGSHIYLTQLDKAWEIAPSTHTVRVAAPDTGIRMSHEDLAPNVLYHLRYNFRWDTTDPLNVEDSFGHGTPVNGILGAAVNNNKGGVSGSWYTEIIPIRVSANDGSTSLSDMARAVRYASDNGARVISISFTGADTWTYGSLGDYVTNNDGLLFAGSGNNGAYYEWTNWPNLIVVGATTNNNVRASFSNYGPFLDLMAPGTSLYTTSRNSDTSYTHFSGTSASTPAAATVAAYLWSVYPQATHEQVRRALFEGALDLGEPGWDPVFGHGLVDAYSSVQLLEQILDGTAPDVTPPTVEILYPFNGETITCVEGITVKATDDTALARVEVYANDILVANQSASGKSSQFTTYWEPVPGSYTLLARAYDLSGNSAEFMISVSVLDSHDAPNIVITSPEEDFAHTGNLPVSVFVSENTERVDYFVNGDLYDIVISPPYSTTINANSHNGDVTIIARASTCRDITAQTSVSGTITEQEASNNRGRGNNNRNKDKDDKDDGSSDDGGSDDDSDDEPRQNPGRGGGQGRLR